MMIWFVFRNAKWCKQKPKKEWERNRKGKGKGKEKKRKKRNGNRASSSPFGPLHLPSLFFHTAQAISPAWAGPRRGCRSPATEARPPSPPLLAD
jgi:hypothetical protein